VRAVFAALVLAAGCLVGVVATATPAQSQLRGCPNEYVEGYLIYQVGQVGIGCASAGAMAEVVAVRGHTAGYDCHLRHLPSHSTASCVRDGQHQFWFSYHHEVDRTFHCLAPHVDGFVVSGLTVRNMVCAQAAAAVPKEIHHHFSIAGFHCTRTHHGDTIRVSCEHPRTQSSPRHRVFAFTYHKR
jgi:hypothetical protein